MAEVRRFRLSYENFNDNLPLSTLNQIEAASIETVTLNQIEAASIETVSILI